MYVDKMAEFGDGVTAVATSGAVTPMVGSYDKGAALNDLGIGEPIFVVFQVDTAVVSAGLGASVSFAIVDDDGPALPSPAVLAETGPIAEALLVAGYTAVLALPPGSSQRYLGAALKASGESTTGGTVSAFMTHDYPKRVNYPAGSTVL